MPSTGRSVVSSGMRIAGSSKHALGTVRIEDFFSLKSNIKTANLMNQPTLELVSFPPVERRVVVTGLGAVSAAGVGVRALWQALLEGRSCISTIERYQVSDMQLAHRRRGEEFRSGQAHRRAAQAQADRPAGAICVGGHGGGGRGRGVGHGAVCASADARSCSVRPTATSAKSADAAIRVEDRGAQPTQSRRRLACAACRRRCPRSSACWNSNTCPRWR